MNDDHLAHLRRVAPLRDLPEEERARLGVVREGLGRPRRIEPRPAQDDYLAQVGEARAEAAAVDPLVAAGTNPENGVDVLDETLLQMARECAAIGFDRVQAELRGAEVGPLCSRRISGLVQIASIVVAKDKWRTDDVDVENPKVQKIIADFMQHVRQAAEETLGFAEGKRFCDEYERRMIGWEQRLDPPPRGGAG